MNPDVKKVTKLTAKAKPMDGEGQVCVDYGLCLEVSTPLTVEPLDFTINATTPAATVMPGHSASFTIMVSPLNSTTFGNSVTLVASGLPAGATATFSPASIAAGAGATTVTMTIQTALTASAAQPEGAAGHLASRLAPFSLALLLLPFARRLRKSAKRFARLFTVLLILGAGIAAITGLGGCGSTIGYFGQAPTTYTVTVTGTSGTLSHSTTVTLTVQ
jgi:hypothetical protein